MNAEQPAPQRRAIPVTATPPEPQGPPTTPTSAAPGGGDAQEQHQVTVFAALGGQPFFDRLVERFYGRVADDDVLLPLYPEQHDLGPAKERLALFLGQYWGGPPSYSELRGHPRLRMRHAPYAIGVTEKDHWLDAMAEALVETMPEAPLEAELRHQVQQRMQDYFTMAAEHLVNQP